MQLYPLAKSFGINLVRFGRNLGKIKAKFGQNLGEIRAKSLDLGKFD